MFTWNIKCNKIVIFQGAFAAKRRGPGEPGVVLVANRPAIFPHLWYATEAAEGGAVVYFNFSGLPDRPDHDPA